LQGSCGSCWAFSATEQIETDYALATKQLLKLSPQQITSCDKTSDGCSGGQTEGAFDYVRKAGGIELESDYPYTSGGGRTGTCRADRSKFKNIVAGYNTISRGASGEMNMMSQVSGLDVVVAMRGEKEGEAWERRVRSLQSV
jgi:cathepsin F